MDSLLVINCIMHQDTKNTNKMKLLKVQCEIQPFDFDVKYYESAASLLGVTKSWTLDLLMKHLILYSLV